VTFLKGRLKPVPPLDSKRIDQWLTDLDSRDFNTREQAAKGLQEAGELALPALEKKLTEKTVSLEARRRMGALLENTKTVLSADELRQVRAIEVLEEIGSAEARDLLDSLAHGGEGALLTEQAKKALSRLARQPGSK
jgi:hypothetical protein